MPIVWRASTATSPEVALTVAPSPIDADTSAMATFTPTEPATAVAEPLLCLAPPPARARTWNSLLWPVGVPASISTDAAVMDALLPMLAWASMRPTFTPTAAPTAV